MGITNQHFYSMNSTRAYPIDDFATEIADSGIRLPHDILVDCALRWPAAYGPLGFVSSLSVTPTLVSLTIQAATTVDGDPGFVPLAVLSIPQPVDENRMYAVTPQAPGVGGWIVFGPGVVNSRGFSGRFASPQQSLLTARVGQTYRPLPVTSLGVVGGTNALTGTVLLESQGNLSLTSENITVAGKTFPAIFFRLKQLAGATQNVLEQFSAPCNKRPESDTCGDPQPIQSINAVTPNCAGVINLIVEGCATLGAMAVGPGSSPSPPYYPAVSASGAIASAVGASIDCGLSLAETCTGQSQLADSSGKLPTDFNPACNSSATIGGGGGSPPAPPTNADTAPTLSLPFIDDFNDCDGTDWTIVAGISTSSMGTPNWNFTSGDSPAQLASSPANGSTLCAGSVSTNISYTTEGSTGSAATNILVWGASTEPTGMNASPSTGIRVRTDFLLINAGTSHNAGVVAGLMVNSLGQLLYLSAEVDFESNSVYIYLVNGASQITVGSGAIPTSPTFRPFTGWYRIDLLISTKDTNEVNVFAELRPADTLDEATIVSIGPFTVSGIPTYGRCGLITRNAQSQFSYLALETF